MGRTEELSDFLRGAIVGCHLSSKSIREISAMLDLPRSTVGAVIVKWKRLGVTSPLPRSGRPHKLSNQDVQVLERVASENQLSSLVALTNEFQTASGRNVSPRTVRRELMSLGFRGQEATRKSKIIRRSGKSVFKLDSKKTSETKENAVTSNEGNANAGEEHQEGPMNAVPMPPAPGVQPADVQVSPMSHSTEAQS